MNIQTPGLHHLALRVTELRASRHFYGTILGLPVILEGPGMFLFLAGRTAVAVRAADDQTPAGDAFDPHRIGLDHLAMACSTEQELRRVAAALAHAGVPNTGLKVDPTLNREYVAFKDPDGIAWEYYMAPDTTRDTVLKHFDGLTKDRLDAVIVEGEHAAVHYTVDTDDGLVAAFGFFRVVNGEIVEARAFHDPRPPIVPPAARPLSGAGAAPRGGT